MGHNTGLDGLRGIAIVGVLGFHAQVLSGGHLGVVVFFVLSGYLITRLLLEEHDRNGSIQLGAFYARRIARLLPALLVVCAVLALLLLLVAPRSLALEQLRWGLLPTLTYTSNIVGAVEGIDTLGVFVWSWSLALEEQFYLLFPPLLAILLGRKRGRTWACLVAVVGIAVALVERAAWSDNGSAALQTLYVRPDSRMDALLIGCLAALVMHKRVAVSGTRYLGLLSLPVVAAAFVVGSNGARATYTWGMSSVAVVTVLLVLTALHSPDSAVGQVLQSRPLVRLGQTSYALYLWNEVVWPLSHGLAPFLRLPVFLVTTVVLAELSTRMLERPIVVWWRGRSEQGGERCNPQRSPVPD